MDPNARLRIATRIHFALLRHLGERVDVADILRNEAQAREVLWVCEGSGDRELISLARLYRAACAPADRASADTGWGASTTSFGEAPASTAQPRHSASPGWVKPTSWLRRGTRSER